jgi:DNA-binding transcriptional LysR family regulator
MFGDACLNQWIPDFVEEFPDVTLDLEISDRYVDIISEGFDVVVRAGELEDTEFIARTLMKTRQVTIAAPAYLNNYGSPTSPGDLSHHILISFPSRTNASNWEYESPQGKALSVAIKPKVRCNSASMEISLAKSGFGITRIPYLACEQEIDEGSLVTILDDYEIPKLAIHAVYPSRQHLAPKVRAFVDFLAVRCGQRN